MVPVLDAALNSASKVIYVPAIMVRNQIYAGIYVTKQLHFLDALLPELDAALISASKLTQVPAIIDACSIIGCRQLGASI